MAANIDLNDPDIQRYIKMAIASQAVAPPKRQSGGMLGFLWGLLLISMIAALAILAAPRAIELALWFREGMPVAEQPAQPTPAPLPTAYVRPQAQPAQPVVVVQPPAPQPQPAPIEPTQPPPPEPYRVDAGINQSGPYIAVSVPQAAPQVEPQAAPTPMPEPGQPGFPESFDRPDPAQTCMFTGCLRAPAPTPWPTTTGPQPGEPGFRESFEDPGADQ